MSSSSIPLGRLAGAPLRLHWSAIVVGVLLGATVVADVGVLTAAVLIVAFFASIIGHEAAHAYVARHHGIATTSIDLWALGGTAHLEREARTPRAEGWIAAAGPLASLVFGVVGIGAAFGLHALDAPVEATRILAWLGGVNVLLAAFNMLPGAPLDGGRVVRAVRWSRHGDRYRAMREAGQAGRVLGFVIGTLGVWVMVSQRPNGIFLAATGLFIAMNARAEIAHAAVAQRLGGVTIGQLTWYGVAEAGTDMDADSMIWQRQRLGEAGAVAVRGDDGELGELVLEDQLWAVPAEQRPWTMLTSLMAPFNRLVRADPDDELASILPRLNPLRPVVTVWRDGRLLGIVSPKVVREQLKALVGNGV